MSRVLRPLLLAVLVGVLLMPAAAEAKTLTLGSKGKDVRSLQFQLAKHSYLHGRLSTGVYDMTTYHAVMAFQKRNGLARDGVAGPKTQRKLRAELRPRPRFRGKGRRIEVSLATQTLVLVRRNEVVHTISISSGMPGYNTPTGRFAVSRKERMSWSRPYSVWMPLASYFTGGIAFHEGIVPAYPASHGCVRVPEAFAQKVYDWAAYGVEVRVY